MEVKSFVIPYKIRDEIKIHPLGDIHGGIKHCAEKKIKAKVAEIKDDPCSYWIGMGDYGEFITPSDPRWDVSVVADWLHKDDIADDIEKWVVKLFDPIKDKCIGLLEGNHEDAIRTHSHTDVHKHICRDLGVDNLGYTCIISFNFRRRNSKEAHMVKGVFTHGAGWGITQGAKMNRLERFMNIYPTCRIAAMGHVHDKITRDYPYLDIENEKIVDRTRVGMVTGTWFKTYDQGVRASYGEKKGYPPSVLGCPVFVIKPSLNKVWAEV